jgi:hypothetical protein
MKEGRHLSQTKVHYPTVLMTCLPPRKKGRQMCRRNSVGDLRGCDQKTTKSPVQRKNVTDKVIDALTSTDVLDKIMPVLKQKLLKLLYL